MEREQQKGSRWRWLWRVPVGLVVVLAAVYLLRGPLLSRSLAVYVSERLTEELGLPIRIERVEGDWYSDLVLVGLATGEPPADGALRQLTAKRVRVAYRLFDLFDDPLGAIREINGEQVHVVLRADFAAADLDGTNLAATPGPDIHAVLKSLPEGVVIELSGSLYVHEPDGSDIWLPHVTVTGTTSDAHVDIRGAQLPLVTDVAIVEQFRLEVQRPDATTVQISGEDRALGLRIEELVLAAPRPGIWSSQLSVRLAGGTVQAFVDAETVLLRVAEIDLARLPVWVPRLLPEPEVLPAQGRLSLDANGRLANGGLTQAIGRVQLTDAAWDDRTLERAQAELRWSGGVLMVSTLEAFAPDAWVTLVDAEIDPAAPYGVRSARSVGLGTVDAVGLARRMGVDLDGLALPTVPVEVRLQGSMDGPTSLDLQSLQLSTGRSTLTAAGVVGASADPAAWRTWRLRGAGTLALDLAEFPTVAPTVQDAPRLAGTVNGSIEVDGSLEAPGFALRLDGDALQIGDEAVEHLRVAARIDWPQIEQLEVEARTSFGTASIRGRFDATSRRTVLDPISIDLPRLEALARLVPGGAEFSGALRIEGRFSGTLPDTLAPDAPPSDVSPSDAQWSNWLPRDGKGQLEVRGRRLWSGERQIGDVDARLAVDGSTLRVRSAKLRAVGVTADLDGAIDLEERVVRAEHFSAQITDWEVVRAWIAGLPPVEGTVHVRGRGEVPLDDLGASRGQVTVECESFRHDDLHVRNAVIEAEVTADTWSVHSARADVELVTDARTIRTPVELRAPVTVTRSGEGVRLPRTDLELLGGWVQLSGSTGDALTLRAAGTGLEITTVLGDEFGGDLSFDLTLAGSFDRIGEFDVTIDVPTLRYREHTGHVQLSAVQTAAGIEFTELSLDAGELVHIEGIGLAPVRLDWTGLREVEESRPALDLTCDFPAPLRWLGDDAPAGLEVDHARVVIHSDIQSSTVKGEITGVRWRGERNAVVELGAPVRLSLVAGPDGVHLSATCDGNGPISLSAECKSPVHLDWRAPWEWTADTGKLALSGRVGAAMRDVAPLARLVPSLVYASGSLDADVEISGTLAEPLLTGSVRGEGLSARVEGDVPVIDKVRLHLALDRDALVIRELSGRLGYAPLRVTGSVRAPLSDDPEFDLAVHGERALFARTQDFRLRADVDVTVKGLLSSLRVAGDARVTDALFSRSMEIFGGSGGSDPDDFVIFSLRDPPLSAVQFNVRVRADETIRVDNNLAHGRLSADLRLLGTGELPMLRGRVFLKDVVVTLPFSRLTVRQGSLEFREDRPFDPELRANAETRMKGYDLRVEVAGPVSNAQVFVSSLPALPQEDALLLLSTGATPQELEREGIATTALSRAGTLVGESIVRWFAGPSDPDTSSLLDRVTLEVGRDVSRSGVETVDAEFELSERWYLRMERDRYDAYNGGLVWRLRFR